MKEERFKKVVEWTNGENLWMIVPYLILVIISLEIMKMVWWEEFIVLILLLAAGTFLALLEFPKRKVYWMKLK